MLTSAGIIRRPPSDEDRTLFGANDPFQGPLRPFERLGRELAVDANAAREALMGRTSRIIHGIAEVSMPQVMGTMPFSPN